MTLNTPMARSLHCAVNDGTVVKHRPSNSWNVRPNVTSVIVCALKDKQQSFYGWRKATKLVLYFMKLWQGTLSKRSKQETHTCTHARTRACTQASATKQHTHTQLPAGAIVANLVSSAHALHALGILCFRATKQRPFQVFAFPPISLPLYSWLIPDTF